MFELEPHYFTLSNGIRVVFERKEAFVAHMGVMILAGSRFERWNEIGLAHFVEHSVFKGTKKRKALDIFSDLDSVGGELNAYTNKEELCLHTSFRKIHLEIASELLADIVQNATFPEKELQKEKAVVQDEIMSYLDNPSERINDEFEAHLFPDHPLGYNILGTNESVDTFTQRMLQDYIKRLFVAQNMVISVVGNFEIAELTEVLERDFSGVKASKELMRIQKPSNLIRFDILEKKGVYQSHIMIGGFAPSYNDEKRRLMTLVTNYLGGPALNARLVLSIREKYGYSYNVEANYTAYSDSGYWSIYAGTDTRFLTQTIDLIYTELEDVRKNGLSVKEVKEAKEQLKGHLALSLDSNLELMFSLAKSLLIFGKVDSVKEIYEQIDGITTKDVAEFCSDLFRKEIISQLVYDTP